MKKILVLGSEGLLGKSLVAKLNQSSEYHVYEFDIKNPNKTCSHEDLSANPKSKEIKDLMYCIGEADFVFFLAFNVGGAQYLKKYEHTTEFISDNVKIMDNVFSCLNKNNKPFIFASSMMTKIPISTYGILKTLGERYTKSLDGISVRFWNIYGPEKIEQDKNHVMTDFILSALNSNKIDVKTDGQESRQFIYVDDASDALIKIMESYTTTKDLVASDNNCIDVSNGTWTTIKDIASNIASKTGASVTFNEQQDRVQCDAKIEPNLDVIKALEWHPIIGLDDGINMMIANIKNLLGDIKRYEHNGN